MSLTKAEKKVEKNEQKEARERAKKSAKKMQLQEFMYAGGIGLVEGYAEKSGFSIITDGLGPLKFEYLQAIGGYLLATKKSGKARELGSAMATIGLYKIGKGMGSGFELGGFLGGGE